MNIPHGTMTDATAEFFEGLAARGHEPALEKVTGTVRVDATDGARTERWLVAIDKGDVAVSRRNAKADCVVRGEKALLDRIVTGEANPMTAFLRGSFSVEGDRTLLVIFQRLFPGLPREDA
jgi:putative sterol carrier protein